MRELRTQENKEFENFFDIVRKAAAEKGCVFFVDCGEGREFFTSDLEGEDLFGWLIPGEQADQFEEEFRTFHVAEKWDDFQRFANWHNDNNKITITFDE